MFRLIIISLLLLGCARQAIREPSEAMRLTDSKSLTLRDDLQFKEMGELLDDHIAHFSANPDRLSEELQFGPVKLKVAEYLKSLRALKSKLNENPSTEDWAKFVREHFDLFEVYGREKWGDVFITGYFDPVIKGSLTPTDKYFRPVYRVPDDMLLVRMDEFATRFPHWSVFQTETTEQKSPPGILRGRIVERRGVKQVYPYYDRHEIDGLGLLRGRGLELAFVDPVDIFVLQIQGSGTIELENGKTMRIGYAAQNGYPYVPIGKYLLDKMPKDQVSIQSIERFVRALPSAEAQAFLDQNPSYVFFDVLKGNSKTTVGTVVRPGRTIATDRQYFPKGTLAYLEFDRPVFSGPEAETPESWQATSRFVMDQDTGGAIRGPGRLDLYCGRGAEARQMAGVMKSKGRLFYLVPKSNWLSELASAALQ